MIQVPRVDSFRGITEEESVCRGGFETLPCVTRIKPFVPLVLVGLKTCSYVILISVLQERIGSAKTYRYSTIDATQTRRKLRCRSESEGAQVLP